MSATEKYKATNLLEFCQEWAQKYGAIEKASDLKAFFIDAEKFKFEWNENNRHCEICDVKLTNENFAGLDSHDYNFCCKENSQFKNVFQPSIIRHKLGIQETRYAEPRNIPSFYQD